MHYRYGFNSRAYLLIDHLTKVCEYIHEFRVIFKEGIPSYVLIVKNVLLLFRILKDVNTKFGSSWPTLESDPDASKKLQFNAIFFMAKNVVFGQCFRAIFVIKKN